VIGGGSAGLVGARTAASFGASVPLVERDRPGAGIGLFVLSYVGDVREE